jgi:NTP pyrophosphatase (non-canonical NTP hydrolase)
VESVFLEWRIAVTLDEYQEKASATDASEIAKNPDLSVLLLGLAGETGSLLTLYKKRLRDGDAFQVVEERLSEEMGDILWYLAAIARRCGLSLESIAADNLVKTASRWLSGRQQALFDAEMPTAEQLPRQFKAILRDSMDSEGKLRMTMEFNGEPLGAELTDNAHDPDGYRFHDILHLSFAAILGWSPVIRALLKRKRKSNARLDEIEDGGRAIAIEEGIAALIFTYAMEHSLLHGVETIDWGILRTCHAMSAGLEVGRRALFDWEQAIVSAFGAWREAIKHGGVRVIGDLEGKKFVFEPLSDQF